MKIFLLISFFFVLSCRDNQRKIENELLDFEVDRFEKKFFETHDDSLLNLIEEYPFLFSKRFNEEDWVAIKSDTIRNDIYKRTITIFNDFKTIENEITKIFKQTKSYFPKFIPPKLITLNNGIDYEYKIIDSDSLILLSLDCYLGQNEFYKNIPKHVSTLMYPDFIPVDISEIISSRFIQQPRDRKFISKIIYYGKLLFFMNLISGIEPTKALGYDKSKEDWIKENEKEIWEYFVSNEIIFSTKSSLDYRFLANAPFSKFGLTIDFESPPMVGRYIGYKIVKSYYDKKTVNVVDLLKQDNYKLYLMSNYKPKK